MQSHALNGDDTLGFMILGNAQFPSPLVRLSADLPAFIVMSLLNFECSRGGGGVLLQQNLIDTDREKYDVA